jgi:hypothetical protein
VHCAEVVVGLLAVCTGGMLLWGCLLGALGGSCFTKNNFRTVHTASSPAPFDCNVAIPVLDIICGSSLHCTPDDGHIDARNMLS